MDYAVRLRRGDDWGRDLNACERTAFSLTEEMILSISLVRFPFK
jgi:hypothetical protein